MSSNPQDLANVRTNYQAGSLALSDTDPDPILQFTHWMDDALAAEISDANAMTLSTVDSEQQPSARIVLLKGFDATGFCFFTNYRLSKAMELADNPKAALVFFWKELERQICIRGTVTKGSREVAATYFHSRPHGSQIGAWVSSEQSRPVANRQVLSDRQKEFHEKWPEGTEISLPDFWGNYCLEPITLEFWQGGSDRIHDRILYTRSAETWSRQRLSP